MGAFSSILRQQVETIQAAMDFLRRELQKNRIEAQARNNARGGRQSRQTVREERAAVSSLPPAKRALVVLFQSLDVLGFRGGLGPF